MATFRSTRSSLIPLALAHAVVLVTTPRPANAQQPTRRVLTRAVAVVRSLNDQVEWYAPTERE